MDKKQNHIFKKILKKFELQNKKITFIQHRNLTEFKYFKIEKINPTHRILLFGILKNNNKKKDTSKSIIKVGEILIGSVTFFSCSNIIYENIDFISLCVSMYFLNVFIFYWFGRFNLFNLEVFKNDCWNRGFFRRWKNNLNG